MSKERNSKIENLQAKLAFKIFQQIIGKIVSLKIELTSDVNAKKIFLKKVQSANAKYNIKISDILFSIKENKAFLEKTLEGIDLLFKDARKFLSENKIDSSNITALDFVKSNPLKYTEIESTRQVITILQPKYSYTSNKLMKNSGIQIVENLDAKYDKIAAWQHDCHWYLLINDKEGKLIIDVRSGEKSKLEIGDNNQGYKLLNLDIQTPLSKVLMVHGICGKICIALYKSLIKIKADNLKLYVSKFQSLIKNNSDSFKAFSGKITKLVSDDSPIEYEVIRKDEINNILAIDYVTPDLDNAFKMFKDPVETNLSGETPDTE